MIEFAIVAAVGVEENVLAVPPIVFAAIALAVFVFLAFVVWSFRDVSNRHSHKTGGQAGHHSGASTSEHD